jgi:hypothetical protein
MKSPWLLLNDRDREAVRIISVFLNGRLAEEQIVNWAVKTKPHEITKRMAVLQLLESLDLKQLKDPWRSAWRLIEESWDHEPPQSSQADAYRVRGRIAAGERSGSLISAVVATVQPRLNVKARSERTTTAKPKRPRRAEDILLASISSHELTDLSMYQLETIDDLDFLVTLGVALDGAVNDGIGIGRRLGWASDHKHWRLGGLYYVGYRSQDDEGHRWDVDRFHRGIAPAVKLLDAVVKRISTLDVKKAREFVLRWKEMPTPIHIRLWASLSQIVGITSATELSDSLQSLKDRPFWDIHAFPEITELRAIRFNQLSEDVRRSILTRIKRGPPSIFWRRGSDRARVKSAKVYWAARELRRIELGGSQLPLSASSWLAGHLHDSFDLKNMDSIQFGFLSSGIATRSESDTEDTFSNLIGQERLRRLEAALASTRSGWNDDPAERASNWIRSDENANLILSDFEATNDGGAEFPNTWDQFGWFHRVENLNKTVIQEQFHVGDRVLALLELLPTATITPAIEGITSWISSWERIVAKSPKLLAVWTKLWPIAAMASNEASDETETISLNQIVQDSPDVEPSDLDTLNTAAGRLVGVFLSLCPNVQDGENLFEKDDSLRFMRDTIINAVGKSGLIGRHRFIETLPYFLNADEKWSKQNLVKPLVANDAQSLSLWRAIARRTQFSEVLGVIGDQFADRALDRRLGRETRGSLLSSLVLESLHAFREKRPPVITNAKVQQTLRAVDDEVRANAAQTVERFLNWMAGVTNAEPRQTATEVFRLAVAPFLREVWPQERSLATRGVSAAFAELPATAGGAFSEAVSAIERFIVPFDCWSISDFGLAGVDEDPRLASIDTPEMAAALLRLLDLSIGTADGSVIPTDLDQALDQIRSAAGTLVKDSAFRRLSTLARRR